MTPGSAAAVGVERRISPPDAPLKAYVIPAGEEEVIARETAPVAQSLMSDCRGRGA
jgi:acetate kinase